MLLFLLHVIIHCALAGPGRTDVDIHKLPSPSIEAEHNPLSAHFERLSQGPGLWKWPHYFPIYHRHLHKYRGTDAVIAEVGIFSGGSLKMWREYFGPRATIIGIDLSNRTRVYERNPTYGSPDRIFVGDQSSASFWEYFKTQVPKLDVFLDDGGHQHIMQKTTLDALWAHLHPGGVYVCEDVQGANNEFAMYVFSNFVYAEGGINAISTFCHHGNAAGAASRHCIRNPGTKGDYQPHLAEAAFYPYVIVLSKRTVPLPFTEALRHGTLWQPPLDSDEFKSSWVGG